MRIHDDHYDWWMFPIDRKSSMGYDFTVYSGATSYLPPSLLPSLPPSLLSSSLLSEYTRKKEITHQKNTKKTPHAVCHSPERLSALTSLIQ